ncbi:MAG TPA: HlyD family efflux transporter periplasmic adaptor subunit [Bacteroidales bacterium]|nr:HlyD family efflux transporter periplasmic adaptor subunit [Bacteroidales bacterium]
MKYPIIFLNVIYLGFMLSCGSLTHDDRVQEEETHTQEEGGQPHTYAAEDELASNESEAQAQTHIQHTVIPLQKRNFRSVLKTSGQILVDKKDEIIITAKSPGIVRFSDHFLFAGVRIDKEQTLFSVSGESMTENNTGVNYARCKSDYETALANYERAQELINDKLITQKYFLETKNLFEKFEADYLNFSATVSGSSSNVISPNHGYIKEIYVTEGQKVEPGDRLASIIIEHNLIVKADVAPGSISVLQNIDGANFTTGYNNNVYSTEDMNGKLISFGRSTGKTSYFIPVYFRVDYTPELIPGTFVDVWLTGQQIENTLVVPNSAIMEEFGKYYVFIETADGEFLKQYFAPGPSDGMETQVLDGLHEGALIVSAGAYQVKLSQMTSSAPDSHQGHTP